MFSASSLHTSYGPIGNGIKKPANLAFNDDVMAVASWADLNFNVMVLVSPRTNSQPVSLQLVTSIDNGRLPTLPVYLANLMRNRNKSY